MKIIFTTLLTTLLIVTGSANAFLFQKSTIEKRYEGALDTNWDNFIIHYWKLHESTEYMDYLESYIRATDFKLWNRFKSDEFKLRKLENKAAEEIRSKLSTLSLDNEYIIQIGMTFGNYNFDREEFPLNGINSKTEFRVIANASPYLKKYHDGLPGIFTLYFSNPEIMSGSSIKMPAKNAEYWIKNRSSKKGIIDRKVHALVRYNILGINEDGANKAYLAEIIKVEIYMTDGYHIELAIFE